MHGFIGELVLRGLSVILVSSELPEVMGVADRIVVMNKGRIVKVLDRSAFDARRHRHRRDRRGDAAGAAACVGRSLRSSIGAMPCSPGSSPRWSRSIALRAPVFLSAGSLDTLITDGGILAMMALAQMLALLTRGIDLSVAANMALVGMVTALVSRAHPEAPVVLDDRALAGAWARCSARSTPS